MVASYPLLAPLPGWEVDPRFRPVEAVTSAGDLPIVLTRVGRERPLDYTNESRQAVSEALHAVLDSTSTRLLPRLSVYLGADIALKYTFRIRTLTEQL